MSEELDKIIKTIDAGELPQINTSNDSTTKGLISIEERLKTSTYNLRNITENLKDKKD